MRAALFDGGLYRISPLDQMTRRKMAGTRAGGALIAQTYRPIFDTRAPEQMVAQLHDTGHLPVFRNREHDALRQAVSADLMPQITEFYPEASLVNLQITELPPGAEIARHRDQFLLAQFHRLHVPLITDPKVQFGIDGQVFFLQPDRLYELDNTRPHAVWNRASVTRLHFLIDLLPKATGVVKVYDTPSEFTAAAQVT